MLYFFHSTVGHIVLFFTLFFSFSFFYIKVLFYCFHSTVGHIVLFFTLALNINESFLLSMIPFWILFLGIC